MRDIVICVAVMATILFKCRTAEDGGASLSRDSVYNEPHRPRLHFSPPANWMNDPNGMVYHKGQYHLFYQYYPDATVWGPMHWGHAVTRDLLHWENKPVALYPDSLGYIFSGSAVVDKSNTSGLGTADSPPLVAIFTYHSAEGEKAGATDYQNQGIAYSLDDGATWRKYEGNPVLKNQGIRDFRDPKVFWHDPSNEWVMILAVKDHVELWGSKNLLDWTKLSDFGADFGAHGGVWECPDLFELPVEGSDQKKWVMLVSINPGGPNGGSATQYFTGDFDGRTFRSDNKKTDTLWIDYGPDNYAGVTWSNAPENRRIFLGWMSNWAYAQEVPTAPWRSAMTAPRDLKLRNVNGTLMVQSVVVPEFLAEATQNVEKSDVTIRDSLTLTGGDDNHTLSVISGTMEAKDFSIVLSNNVGQELIFGFDSGSNRFFVDRSGSGKTEFSKGYLLNAFAPRTATSNDISFMAVVDVSSIEVFYDGGVTNMTALFFPDEPMETITVKAAGINARQLSVKTLDPVWK